jgi:small GTP-binding protein
MVMAQHAGTAGAAGGAPTADQPGNIRNVVLVGHSGAGKTTLVEALLTATGTINRAGRVEEGTTVSDFDEAEHRQQRSVSLALAPLMHAGVKVNLLDTPGYADFVGDLRAGLRAADAALFVVSSVDGLDGATQMLWEECASVGMPRAVVVTKLDKERADFDESVAVCQRVFGESVLPLYLPMAADDGSPAGVIGLLSQKIFDYSSGTRVERDPDAEHLPLIETARSALIEGIIAESEDETLMDRYLGGEDIELKVLVDDLETAVARGTFYPRSSRRPSPRHWSTRCRRSPHRTADRRARWRPTRPARWSPRWSRPPPTRMSGASPWSACSRGPCARTPPCTCRDTSWATGVMTTTTSTSASGPSAHRSASSSERCRRRSPVTSRPWRS